MNMLYFDPVRVNGRAASPVFTYLRVASGDPSPIEWNFAKVRDHTLPRNSRVTRRVLRLISGWCGRYARSSIHPLGAHTLRSFSSALTGARSGASPRTCWLRT